MIALGIFFLIIPLFALAGVYADRKLSAWIQDRLGPTEVGPAGLFQTFADILKLLTKEDIIPKAADRFLFKLAPALIFISVFAGFAVIPLSPGTIGVNIPDGIYFLLGIVSLEVMGILMAGWASNNKFALIGSMRSIAQVVSYEIPLSLAVLAVVLSNGSMNLAQISMLQQGDLGILQWNILHYPYLLFAFIIYFLASLAECNRGPFDLPEAESELVGGFHTEYSGLRWAFMFLAEYGMMLLTSLLATILFLGSWNTPLPNLGALRLADWTGGYTDFSLSWIWGSFWLIVKCLFLVFLQIMARWTYPRLRVDQLMNLCWKVLTPAALLLIVVAGIWKLFLY